MIGKPEWFTYRIFGWGLRPKSWQGWLYIGAFLALFAATLLLPISPDIQHYLTWGLIAILLIDVLHIMTQLDKGHDERDRLHQLIIERNCSYAAVGAIAGVVIYHSMSYKGLGPVVDMSVIVVLGAMVLAKIASTIYVKTRM